MSEKELSLPTVGGEALGKLVAALPAPAIGKDVRELWFCSRLNDRVQIVWLDLEKGTFFPSVVSMSSD